MLSRKCVIAKEESKGEEGCCCWFERIKAGTVLASAGLSYLPSHFLVDWLMLL